MLQAIPKQIDSLCSSLAEKTKPFVETWPGKVYLLLVFFGPVAFLPTVYAAWTAENIDVFRTPTWSLSLVSGSSSLLGLIHTGDWKLRLVTFVWLLIFVLMLLATIVR